MYKKISLFLLRLSLGGLFFYAGITKILNPEWSAVGYLNNASSFKSLFAWFASPDVLPIVNILNEWGLMLIGLSLILGILVRISAPLGALLMLLYYLALPFPHPGQNLFLIDQHIIFGAALLVLAATRAGSFWSVGSMMGFARK